MEAITFITAVRKFFGKKEGQTLQQFADEIKKLTAEDREEMSPMLAEALGVEVQK